MIKKYSLNLQGHATSVSLEPEFWAEFKAIAARENLGVNALAAKIDAARAPEDNLASSIRLFVLQELKSRLEP